MANTYIHPYYEEYAAIIWLEAKLHFDNAGCLSFTYKIPNSLKINQPELAVRIEHQFEVLELNRRYTVQAAQEVSEIEYLLKKDLATKEKVRHHLSEQEQSRALINKNSWKSALYRALYKSDRFCDIDWHF